MAKTHKILTVLLCGVAALSVGAGTSFPGSNSYFDDTGTTKVVVIDNPADLQEVSFLEMVGTHDLIIVVNSNVNYRRAFESWPIKLLIPAIAVDDHIQVRPQLPKRLCNHAAKPVKPMLSKKIYLRNCSIRQC